jgi:hypothetical protein
VSTSLSQLLEESDLPFELSADLEPVLTALRSLAPEAAPQPSAQLAALLAHPVVPRSYRPRRTALAAVAAVVGSFTLTGVAAAANQLPDPAQQFVSDLSSRYLPFQFPEPAVVIEEAPSREPTPEPEDEAPVAPATTEEPAPASPEDEKPEKTEKPSKKASAVTTTPSPKASPSEPPAPSAPEPSQAPSPSVAEPSVGAEEPVESPTTDGTTSPSPTADPTEPDHARENETPSTSGSPSPTSAPSGSGSPSAG